jgi:hypothetical protein
VISIDDLTIGYGPHPVQSGIRAQIGEGEIFAIVGDAARAEHAAQDDDRLMPPQTRVAFHGVASGCCSERGAVDLHERQLENVLPMTSGRAAASGATRARAVRSRWWGLWATKTARRA